MQVLKRLTLSVAALAIAATAAYADVAWKDIDSKEGKFSVSMPGEAEYSTKTIDTDVGPVEMKLYAVELENGELAFITQFNDYPADKLAGVEPSKLLDGVFSGISEGAQVKSNKEISLGSIPGREVVLQKEGMSFKERYFLNGNRLYQNIVVVVDSKASKLDNEGSKFLDSFKIHSN